MNTGNNILRKTSLEAAASTITRAASKAEKNTTTLNDTTHNENSISNLTGEYSGVLSSVIKKSENKNLALTITDLLKKREELIEKQKNTQNDKNAQKDIKESLDKIKKELSSFYKEKQILEKKNDLNKEEINRLEILRNSLPSKKANAPKNTLANEVEPKLPQNREIVKNIIDEIKLSAKNNLIKSAISQFIDSRIPEINFYNKQFKNQNFSKAFAEELNCIFSVAFHKTDLKHDDTKWSNFFSKNLKNLDTQASNSENDNLDTKKNDENNKNFEHNLKILILAKKLAQIAEVSNNNRFYYFDQNAAQDAFENIENGLDTNDFESSINTFIETYKTNLTKELLKDCEKFEIKNEQGQVVGLAYNIEQLNDDKEHDNLQIRRLQNLAAPTWCTCHSSNCENYLDNANSFLFIPNNGNRILRIQGHICNDNIKIDSVTNIENEHNDDNSCWISKNDDLNHLWAFISTMENNGYNIQAKNNIFNMDEIVSQEEINRIENRFPSCDSLLNKIQNANDINEIIQILNNSPYINIQNGSLKINNYNQNEKNKLIVALHDKNFFNPLNPRRISTIPYSLTFNTQESINLNSITNYSRTMTLTNVHNFNCLNLNELEYTIQQTSDSTIPIVFNIPNLTNAKNIWLSNIENINLPNLKECARLTFGNENTITRNTPTLPDITLEKLEKVNEKFSVLNPQKLNLPSIKYINNFKIESKNNLNNFNFIAPNLERIDNLEISLSNCKDATQIVKKLSSIIKLAKNLTLNINYKKYSKEEIDKLLKEA